MLKSSFDRLRREIPADALVLDVGGWWQPLARADWVIDVMPFETRGSGGMPEDPERFTAETWVQRDICDHEPWPFEDDQFDFVVCSHTLEDIRDPIWACHELNRVAKAGYVEVPSRLEEQTYGVQGPWVGWGHHHWMIDISGSHIGFVFKPHIVHNRPSDHFPAGWPVAEEDRSQSLWWEGGFTYEERLLFEPGELDRYVASLVSERLQPAASPRARALRRLGTALRERGTRLEHRARLMS